MDLLSPENGWIAFLAGLITSPHCLIMCGPLAYVILSESYESEEKKEQKQSKSYFLNAHLIYNTARVFSFTLMGILAGGIGLGLLKFIQFPIVKIFPWILVLFFVIFGLGLDRLIPKAPFAKRLFARLSEHITKLPKNYAAILLGLATPLLPCGPLYMILWVALLSGSPLFGGEIALGFALGTAPLMLLAGSQFKRLKQWLNPKTLYIIQRSIALLAAFLITWRLLAGNNPISVDFCCPW